MIGANGLNSIFNPSNNSCVLVTGANGFVGRAIVEALLAKGCHVRGTMRNVQTSEWSVASPELGEPDADWRAILKGCTAVVHSAGRAHVLKETASSPDTEFRRINTMGTIRLAEQCAEMGVQRFIFISSIGVNGDRTSPGMPFSAQDLPRPNNSYARSKLEAEKGLLRLSAKTGMQIIIIRPPLVYGHDAPGNFRSLIRLIRLGFPLPLGAIYNKRSFIGLENLVSAILHCLTYAGHGNQTLLVSDAEDISTTDLIKRIGNAMGVRPLLLPVPMSLLAIAGKLFGRKNVLDRLCGTLQVDCVSTQNLLNWTPPFSIDQGLKTAVEKKPFGRPS